MTNTRISHLFQWLFTAAFLLCAALSGSAPVRAADPAITFTQPGTNTTIASDRSFYVFGTFDGFTPPAGSVLTITVRDGAGQTVRTVSTAVKDNTSLDAYNSALSYYVSETADPGRAALIASGMPDLVLSPSGSVTDGSVKATYNDSSFHALIVGSTKGKIDDQMHFTAADGSAYTALPEGSYTVRATLAEPGGTVVTADKAITIGDSADKVLGRFSPAASKAKLDAFAQARGYTVYNDAFPGYWDQSVFAEIKTLWRAADITEYQAGHVHCVLYNFKGTSTSYAVELGSLEAQGVIDDSGRLTFYYYDSGEPTLTDPASGVSLDGQITALAAGDKLAFTRCDTESAVTADNTLNTASPGIAAADTDLGDGIEGRAGDTLALNGVIAPIQNTASDIKDNGDNSYALGNKITTLRYHITGDGVDTTVDKATDKLVRTDAAGGTSPSEVEFRHVFTLDGAWAGKTLTLAVTGYDAHGALVAGTGETLTLKVDGASPTASPTAGPTATGATVTAPGASATVTAAASRTSAAPATGVEGDAAAVLAVSALLVILAWGLAARKGTR